jgi:membrane-bound lytic murein transglycosylase F
MQLKGYIVQLLFLIIILVSAGCREQTTRRQDKAKVVDLEEIRKNGKLVVITDFNSTNYFIYRGQPMGYQYELLQELAGHLGIKLDVIVNNDLEESFECLTHGKCNLIAINLTITKDRRKRFDFTEPHSQTRQVLVQRKPEGWEKLRSSELERQLIRNQLELAEKTIYVQQNTSYSARLKNLSDEIGDTIHIIEVAEEAEQLIVQVAGGKIDYTVCDENVALVNQTYYPNIDVATAVSFPQNMAWAVQKGSDQLKYEINTWLHEFKKTTKYAVIYNKYFKNQRYVQMVESDLFALSSGRISAYDEYFREYSQQIGWDWRLLASLAFQESRFNSRARSWAGAFGLMQLMPTTARRFGVSWNSSPKEQIRAGVEFIQWLDNRFADEITDPEERIKFVLASYNVGYGHVTDAIKLAEKYNKNPRVWSENVETCLLMKSDPQYYKDPVVKFGYCRGIETYNFVIEVIERYEHYTNIIPADNQSVAALLQTPK